MGKKRGKSFIVDKSLPLQTTRLFVYLFTRQLIYYFLFLPAPLGAYENRKDISFFYIFVLIVKRSGFLFYKVDK